MKEVESSQEPEFPLPEVRSFCSDGLSCSCSKGDCRALEIHSQNLHEQAKKQRESLSQRILAARELRKAVYLTSHELVSVFEKLVEKESAFLQHMESLTRTASLYEEKEDLMAYEEENLVSRLISEMNSLKNLEAEYEGLAEEKIRLDTELLQQPGVYRMAHSEILDRIKWLESCLPELRAEVQTLEEVYVGNCEELEEIENKFPGLHKQLRDKQEILSYQYQIEQYLNVRQSEDRVGFFREYESLLREERWLEGQSRQREIDVLEEKLREDRSHPELKE